MEKITAIIRDGVIDHLGNETEQFKKWKNNCTGSVIISEEWIYLSSGIGKQMMLVIFENEDDRTLYIMSYVGEPIHIVTAYVNCPYVPT